MISVSTAAYKALYAEELALKLRVRWYLHHSSTGFMDVSDRVSNVSPFTQSSSPFLGGFDLSGFTVTLKNHDRAFSPVNTQTHLQKGTQSYLNTTMEIHQGVLLPDGTWEYIPVAKGYVQRIYFAEDNIEVAVEDAVSLQLSLPMPEEYTIPGWNGSGQLETLEDVVNDLIALSSLDTSILDSTDPSHKDSFGILQDVGWHFAGTVPSGSSIGDILNEVVRSGLCQMIVTEEGKIRFHLEFPRISANRRLRIDRFPDIIDDTVAFDWQFQQGGRANATEVIVKYQGVTTRHRDTTLEAVVGRIPTIVSMQFCRWQRQAYLAARILYEMHGAMPDTIRFSTFGIGLLIQLNDRIKVRDPINDALQEYRVVTKSWDNAIVQIEAVKEGHTDIVDGTFAQFATTGGTSWSSSTTML